MRMSQGQRRVIHNELSSVLQPSRLAAAKTSEGPVVAQPKAPATDIGISLEPMPQPRGATPSAETFEGTEELGISTAALGLATFDGIRGVVATQDVGAGELLVTVPLKSTLRVTETERNPLPEVADSYWDQAAWDTRLALKLLAEVKGPSRLPWYLRVLPSEFLTPFLWHPKQIESLQYPVLEEALRQQKKDWEGQYAALAASSPRWGATFEDFVWALSAVRSRSLRGDIAGGTVRIAAIAATLVLASLLCRSLDQSQLSLALGAMATTFTLLNRDVLLSGTSDSVSHFLLPVIDMINHHSNRATDPAYVQFNIRGQRVEVVAGAAVPAGQEVFITYRRSNDALLQYYGFVEPDNAQDVYQMPGLPDMVRSGQWPGLSPDVLDASPDVLKALETIELTREGVDAKAVQAIASLLGPQTPAGVEQAEGHALQVVVQLAQATMERWDTNLEQDLAALRTATSEVDRLILSFRVEKKKLLRAFVGSPSIA